MQRCLDLASKGLGAVAPNPMVGAVIVYNGKIIGEGFHEKFGSAHAEVNAIRSVIDKSMLKKSTLYVNLEPCAHLGKTPPCTDLIISSEIPKVVIGCKDPSQKVNGKGIQQLKKAGIKVTDGVLGTECQELNKRFFTWHLQQRPYVILKWAQSSDGFIGMQGKKTSISGKTSEILLHKWRSEEQSIMVGTNTAETDNPRLDSRHWNNKNPLRLVIDKELRLSSSLHLFDQRTPTCVFTFRKKKSSKNLQYIQIDKEQEKQMIQQILYCLYLKEIHSVIVEGGSTLLNSFLYFDLWDEARIFTGNKRLIQGIPAPEIASSSIAQERVGEDSLTIIRKH